MSREEAVDELFARALALSPNEREALFAEVSANGGAPDCEDLVDEVRALLHDHVEAEANGFLQQPLISAETDEPTHVLSVGQDFEGYKILSLIEEGGMGEVYLAQDKQLERKVAIKLIKSHLKTKEVLRRFHNERQILANLQHPNIAQLFEARATADGLPFFVMEYVEGKSIDKYAAEHGLSITDRLKLFRTVCSAVSYAHQNLVIHRDIKPGNILVAEKGEPKLLDFGIAKLLHEADSEEQDVTATLFRVMTPEYASPEQVKGERITTASDVYSLGVLLYELLTGHRPYRVKSRRPEEIVKAICEQEPERPSLAVTRGNGDTETRGKPNSKSEIRNPKFLRGDLDNIILMALRKEPSRRYASVEQFSEDIRRHLEGLPVIACKATVSYRASKFVQRNKIGVAAAAIILLTLIGGIIATAWEAHKTRVQSARAERRFNDVRKLANTYMFEFHDSIKDLPGSLAARQLVIKRALEYLDSLAAEAGDDRGLQLELANAYQQIGRITFDVDQMIDVRRRAMVIREALLASDSKNDDYRNQLSDSYEQISDAMKIAGNTGQQLEFAKKSVQTIETAPFNQLNLPSIQNLVYEYLTLGLAQEEIGDYASAIQSERKAVEMQNIIVAKNVGDKEALRTLGITYGYLSHVLEDNGEQALALDFSTKNNDIARVMLASDTGNIRYRRDIALGLQRDGRLRAAMGDLSSALQSLNLALLRMQELSSDDPQDKGHRLWLSVNYLLLGNVLDESKRDKESLDDYTKAIEIAEPLAAGDSKWREAQKYLTQMFIRLGSLLSRAGKTSSATDYLQRAISRAEEQCNRDPQNARTRRDLAEAYESMAINRLNVSRKSADQNMLHEARSWLEKSFGIWQDMKNKRTLSGADANKPDELAKEIAKCDAALSARTK
jgi:serine/threonine protein kinase/tetratricopeptide (TPR) repeat protein